MEFDWVEWYGYLASLVVLVSLTMSSIIKLRVINFIGCLLFASFAYFIGSAPTMLMNLCIAGINVYYLYQMYNSKEEFKIISASNNSEYFQHFISVNQDDIEKQINLEKLKEAEASFYMLRDNNIAGLLAGQIEENGVFTIMLDYVIPRYRDFKLGSYYYNTHPEFIKAKGINTLKAFADNDEHCFYLEKMGFVKQSENDSHTYIKRL
ncbi:YgjV family protein [Psychromonas aquimarina]|uniref:YgjV family protein n=1 Tax=Psychromonas aquimarina TaxID=444919 RepID=UPI00048E27A7|nr:YgjV family protein [Psychromonas aquimarina]